MRGKNSPGNPSSEHRWEFLLSLVAESVIERLAGN